MSYLNSITLVGFVGADTEQRQAKGNGSKFTVFSLAAQRSWKNADDEWSSKTEQHRVVLFKERLADHVARTISDADLAVLSTLSEGYSTLRCLPALPRWLHSMGRMV
jgi:single-stranded DNA-binding protein